MDELKKWSPIAFDHLQPAKKLIGFVANLLTLLMTAQAIGLDVHMLSNGFLTPELKLWHTAIVWVVAVAVWFRLSNEQEHQRRNGLSNRPRHKIRNAVATIEMAIRILQSEPGSDNKEETLGAITKSLKSILRVLEKEKAAEATKALEEIGPETKPPES
jgi:hypothetical protein